MALQNRWNYFLISERLKNGGKEQHRYRRSKLRTIINIIFGALGVGVLAIVIAYGGIVAILAGGMFFGCIFGFLFSMHYGKDILLTQCAIVKEQLNHDMEVNYNKGLVKLGFVLCFAPIYIIMLLATLMPGGYLWIIPYLPFFFIVLILSHMSRGFVDVFNYNIHKYRACHLGAHLFVLIVGSFIRILVITPAIQ